MILKASQRGGGQDLAAHLLRTDDNEHVRVHEVRGFAAHTLHDAFKEAEAISLGTRCRQYLFSLSLSPPDTARVPVERFEQAVGQIEERLGLTGQPRAIVFHEKEGRRHAHCIWSRIDAATMTARPLPFFKAKLMAVARGLYLDYGWTMPRGFVEAGQRDPTNFSLAEWQQAKRQGLDPRWLKQTVQACWAVSDNARAFRHSLEERGYFLARGGRRSFVVIGYDGEVHALPRALGVKTKEVAARLGDGVDLASVEATQALIGARMRPFIRRHIEASRAQFRVGAAILDERKEAMTQAHRTARTDLDERLAGEWQAETATRAARLPRGLTGLWQRLTGRYQATQRQNQAEAVRTLARHAGERRGLVEAQLDERQVLQTEIKTLRHTQAEQLTALRREVGRYLARPSRDAPQVMRRG